MVVLVFCFFFNFQFFALCFLSFSSVSSHFWHSFAECPLPKVSLFLQHFSLFEIIPSSPITTGMTVPLMIRSFQVDISRSSSLSPVIAFLSMIIFFFSPTLRNCLCCRVVNIDIIIIVAADIIRKSVHQFSRSSHQFVLYVFVNLQTCDILAHKALRVETLQILSWTLNSCLRLFLPTITFPFMRELRR